MRARRIKLDAKPVPVDNGSEQYTTRHLVSFKLQTDQRFNNDAKSGRAGGRIEKAVSGQRAFADLEPADWELLRDSLESPNPIPGAARFQVYPVHLTIPMIDDIVNAPEIEVTAADEAKPNGAEETKPAN